MACRELQGSSTIASFRSSAVRIVTPRTACAACTLYHLQCACNMSPKVAIISALHSLTHEDKRQQRHRQWWTPTSNAATWFDYGNLPTTLPTHLMDFMSRPATAALLPENYRRAGAAKVNERRHKRPTSPSSSHTAHMGFSYYYYYYYRVSQRPPSATATRWSSWSTFSGRSTINITTSSH